MPVFISYAHEDKEFATDLALQLVRHRNYVWIDQWELQVGDSIIEKIESAITEASALIIVLSTSSVQSEWCRKELSAGLLRELEEKRVIVLPVLLEDCEIPLFVRGKVYADFRTDFDAGLQKVLEATARVTSEALGRVETPEWHVDWAMDWDLRGGHLELTFILIDYAIDQPFSCLTELKIIANDETTARYAAFAEEGLDWFQRWVIIEALAESTSEEDLRILLEDQHAKNQEIECRSGELGFHVSISARRVGVDTGRDILLDLGEQLRRIRDAHRTSVRPLTADEQQTVSRLRQVLSSD